jgi:hypothetical protein
VACIHVPGKEEDMRKISWLLATVGAAALVSVAAVQGVAASAKPASAGPEPASVLRFSTMTPVTGPYVGPANPIRGEAGGGLPWLLTSGHGSLNMSGHLVVHVRGLVLARQAPVPPALQGTNPFPAFRALVSCQTIGAGNTATVTNVSTGNFEANKQGDSTINAQVSLPRPCIAPIVFVTGPAGSDFWFAVTGS